jgi:cobalt-zinc-cadmium efflux system membrane fusion protein
MTRRYKKPEGKMRAVSILAQSILSIVFVFIYACDKEDLSRIDDQGSGLPPSLKLDSDKKIQIVDLSDQQTKTLRIVTKKIQSENFSYVISIPGVVHPAPDYISVVSAPIAGRVVGMYAHEGDEVQKGKLLMELESLEFANFVSDYLQARAEKLYQANQLERIQLLVEKKISPQRTLEKVQADYTRAIAAEQAARTRLLSVGVKNSQIISWDAGMLDQPNLKFYAPISGVITEHKIDHGQAVSNYEEIMTIINLEKIMVQGYASPDEGDLINPGDSVEITLKDFPDKKLMAAVTTINPALDPLNKSITINVISKTDKKWPLPGQNVRLNVQVTTPEPVIFIPISAIEYEEELPAVFIRLAPDRYEKRFVKLKKITAEAAIVESGLTGNEEIAVSQVFSLKALSKFEEFGEE